MLTPYYVCSVRVSMYSSAEATTNGNPNTHKPEANESLLKKKTALNCEGNVFLFYFLVMFIKLFI